MRKQWLAATAALLGAAFVSAQAQGIQVQSKTLPNGMKILVQEDASIPNIAFYTFYRVGSRNEHEGITGLSHFFEHMMFNGAKKYGHGEFDSALDNAGGSNNAYTQHDMTVYTDWTPSSALELLFDVEADRIQYLAFDPKVIDSGRQVVYSERRLSVDNSNYGLLNEQLTAAAFTAAPYHWPVVGWPTDIESWTIDDLKAYHAMGYSPANATVVIVGNVKAAEVFALADKYFAPIPSHDVPPPVRTKEPEQRGERRITVHKEAQLPLLMVAYHTVDAKNPDLFPLMVLDEVLTGGQSSRLYKALVDGQLALQVRTNQGTDFDPGTFEVSAQPRAGVAPEKVESVLYAEIEKLQTTPLDAHELQKAKNGMLANNVRQLATINGRASAIGNAEEYLGDWHKVNDFAASVNAVTAADVQRVAAKYLTARNRTVATLIPDTAAKPSSTAGKTGGR
jgi:zinc protease